MTEREDDRTLKPGDVLNSTYEIGELVGAGGTGEVYAAVNLTRRSDVAIKVLKREFSSHERFLDLMRREASVLHEITDDAVVRYYDLQQTSQFGGLVFLVMGFIRGPSLAKLMQAGPVSPDKLMAVARRVAQGLEAAHAKQAYHRDISPDNILLKGGDPERATLIDFGIAKDVGSGGRTVVGGGFAGKFEYAAPEQMHGQADARSDIYSLGMTLLAAFRGKHPRLGGTYDEILDAKSRDQDLSDVPEPQRGILARMLAPRPKDRFQSAAELRDALDAVARGASPDAAPDAAPDRSPDAAPGGARGPREAAEAAEARAGIGEFLETASSGSGGAGEGPPPRPKSGRPAPKGADGGGRSAVGGALALLLVAALAGAGWFFGMGPGKELVFGPELPTAAPYRLSVAAPEGGPVKVSGNAPSIEAAERMKALMTAALPGAAVALTPALGAPGDGWVEATTGIAAAAAPLIDWSLEVYDARAALRGVAPDAATRDAAAAAARAAARAGGLRLDASLELRAPPVALRDLQAAAASIASCGPLTLTGGRGGVLGPEDALTVAGDVPDAQTLDRLRAGLEAMLDGRPLRLDMQVLNDALCQVEQALPIAGDSGLSIAFGYGSRPDANPDGVYREGENPVIDVVLPADAAGRLFVVYVDAQGLVFHMIPHQARPNNRVEEIAETGRDGARVVRVAYPIEMASRETLAYRVTPPFGTNMVLAILTDEPLFPQLRPREESIEAFVPDLRRALSTGRTRILGAARRVIRTAP